MVFSVCLSVCLSVTPFWLCSHHRIIMKFSGVITNDQSKVHAKGQGQRSKVKVTEVTTELNRFRTVTPVNEFTYDDEMMHIAWCCLEEVPYCFSRSSLKFQGHPALKIVEFDLDWAFLDCNSSLNSPMATKWCTKLEVASKRCPIFSCDQAALQMVFSVRPSVRLSVCLSVRLSVCLSHLFHHVPIIVSSWNFQELLPWSKVMSMQKVKVRGQRSRSQRSTPNLAVSGL